MLFRRVVLLLAFVVVAVTGCSEGAPAGIQTVFDPCQALIIDIDVEANADQRGSVETGLGMWNTRADAALALPASLPDDDVTQPPRIPLYFDRAGTAFHGFYDDVEGIVYVNDGIVDDRARSLTVAHEIGHAFGMVHVDPDDRPSLMNPGNLSVGLTEADVATLVDMWGACTPAP